MDADPDIGLMRQTVTIQSAVRLPGPGGQMLATWTDVTTRRAHVEPITGRQVFQAMQVKVTCWYKVRMRSKGIEITAQANRLVYKGRALNIESVYRVDSRDFYYEIMCTELKTA